MTSFLQIFQFPGQIEGHNFKIINQVINLFFPVQLTYFVL